MANETFTARLKNAWNVFLGKDEQKQLASSFFSGGDYARPDRIRYVSGIERSILSSLYTRIAIDAAANRFEHVRVNENDRFLETVYSDLQNALTVSANIDQTGRSLIQDLVMSLLDEGCVAVVPVDTTIDPNDTASFSIKTLRVGKITYWYPQHVRVNLYNEKKGLKEEITVSKNFTAIIENPLYAVMNEPNSTLKRLIKKLGLLDSIDDYLGSGKLDLIIQLPYIIKTEARKEQAEHRRTDIEQQLAGSKYGIAYTDGTEKITQLNRPVENNLLPQIESLTNQLYAQLGLTPAVLDGTATEQVMLNYYNRTLEPILSAMTDEFNRKFLTKTARSQGQRLVFFRDPFKMLSTDKLAEIADKFTRNEILSSNEVRAIIGFYPSDDPRADELINKNIAMNNEVPMEEAPIDEGLSEEAVKPANLEEFVAANANKALGEVKNESVK